MRVNVGNDRLWSGGGGGKCWLNEEDEINVGLWRQMQKCGKVAYIFGVRDAGVGEVSENNKDWGDRCQSGGKRVRLENLFQAFFCVRLQHPVENCTSYLEPPVTTFFSPKHFHQNSLPKETRSSG